MIKLSDLKAGDTITLDEGFTCLDAGDHTVLMNDTGPCVRCSEGLHYLDAQEDMQGDLVGVIAHKPAKRVGHI
ncbi:hypothetical protein [uncultured Tateyamaria sp.]|uniref:hypothetical protein n=1 Tax=Tateyamaria sp. 1078 TaxID=3417464 RepID=UPI002612BAF5|nr:hypothetical protein [uncultured Tateyamaria sp.]